MWKAGKTDCRFVLTFLHHTNRQSVCQGEKIDGALRPHQRRLDLLYIHFSYTSINDQKGKDRTSKASKPRHQYDSSYALNQLFGFKQGTCGNDIPVVKFDSDCGKAKSRLRLPCDSDFAFLVDRIEYALGIRRLEGIADSAFFPF
jgi:hypothetical protein